MKKLYEYANNNNHVYKIVKNTKEVQNFKNNNNSKTFKVKDKRK